jgi:hypothetical protein
MRASLFWDQYLTEQFQMGLFVTTDWSVALAARTGDSPQTADNIPNDTKTRRTPWYAPPPSHNLRLNGFGFFRSRSA